MIRVVIDPGVFISALIGSRGGAPDLVMRAFVDDRIRVVASPRLLAELELVLRRPKFAAYVDERTVRDSSSASGDKPRFSPTRTSSPR